MNKKEVTKGQIYYDQKNITLEVIEPIIQWVVLSDNQTLIYYPEEKSALKIKSKSPALLPFFYAFIGIIKSDFGLSEIGFKLKITELHGDTLFTFWSPAENLKDAKLTQILIIHNDKIIGTKLIDQKENILSESQFKDHYSYGGFYFPLKINITHYQNKYKTMNARLIHFVISIS